MPNCSIYHMLHETVGCAGSDARVQWITCGTTGVKINFLTHVNVRSSPVVHSELEYGEMVIEGLKLGYYPPPQSRKSPHTLVQAHWCCAGPHCLHYQATDMMWHPLPWILMTEMKSVWNIGLCEPPDTDVTCESFIEFSCCESFKTYGDLYHFINKSFHI